MKLRHPFRRPPRGSTPLNRHGKPPPSLTNNTHPLRPGLQSRRATRVTRVGAAQQEQREGSEGTAGGDEAEQGALPSSAPAPEAVLSHPLLNLPPEDNHSRLQVPRQSYIPTPRSKLIEALRAELSEEQWTYMSQVLRCLESIYQVEYQLAGEEVQQVLQHLNHSVIVPDGIQLVDKAEMEALATRDGWDDDSESETWDLEGVPPDALYNTADDADQLNTVYVTPASMMALEAKFLEMCLILLGKAHFRPMSARDSALADTLNASYLAQLFVRPDSTSVDTDFASSLTDELLRAKFGAVAVFTRGWGKERKSGRLLVAKVDYMQQAVAKALFHSIQRLLSVFRRQVKEQVEAAALQVPPALGPPRPAVDAIRPTAQRSEPHSATMAPTMKPKGPNLRQALRKWGRSVREGLAYYGLIPPLDRIRLEEFDEVWPVATPPGRQPVYIERRTVEDAIGKGIPLQAVKGKKLETLFGKIELEEPTFHEMLVLCRPRRTEGRIKKWRKGFNRRMATMLNGEEPPDRPFTKDNVLLRAYKDIPVPLWRIVFPFKALAFRPIDLIRVDMVAVLGLIAIIAQVKSGNAWLQLVWIGSLLLQTLRVVLRYRRMFISFENFVSKTMLSKTVAGQEGVIEFLSRSAALQQYKQVVLLYHVVVVEGTDKLERDPEGVAQDIEHMLSELGGAEVTFDILEAEKELERLGLFEAYVSEDGSRHFRSVVRPEDAVERLKEHWSDILTSQLEQQPASNDIHSSIRALEHHKNIVSTARNNAHRVN